MFCGLIQYVCLWVKKILTDIFEYALASLRTSTKFSFVTNSSMLILILEQCPALNKAILLNDQYVHVLAKEPVVHGDKS